MHGVGSLWTRTRLRAAPFYLAAVLGAYASLAFAQWAIPIGSGMKRLPPTRSTNESQMPPAPARIGERASWDSQPNRGTRVAQIWSDYRSPASSKQLAQIDGSHLAVGPQHSWLQRLPPTDQEIAGPAHSSSLVSAFGGMVPSNTQPSNSASSSLPGYSLFFASEEQEEEKEKDEDKEADAKDSAATKSNNSNGQSGSDAKKPLGEEPDDTSRSFLRSATVLLEPGHIQVDVGLEYVHFESRDLFGVNGDFALERSRRRQWYFPFAVRYGWDKQTQLYMNLPVGAAHLETSTTGGGDTTSVFGMGDVQAGFLKVLSEQDDCGPDVIFGGSFSAPTGADAFHPGRVAYLGSGFWNVETSLSLIKNVDPAVLLAGVSYVHSFQADHLGQQFRLGERFTYDFGAGFAINDTVTFSTILQGSFQFPIEIDGTPLPNSSLEPISLRMALTDYISANKIIEPYVRLGLTEDSPQAELGVITTYSY